MAEQASSGEFQIPGFPKNFKEFSRVFATEDACRQYIRFLKWGNDGFQCPYCHCTRAWEYPAREVFMCVSCSRQTTLRSGTLFHGSNKPLQDWLFAMWFFTTSKRGISAKELQRQLGYGSYQTAWTMLHKIRRYVVVPDRQKLQTSVEVDECYVGAAAPGRRGRGAIKKKVVVCAAEVVGRTMGCGRIRLKMIKRINSVTLCDFVADNVENGASVHTDGWSSYRRLTDLGYRHYKSVVKYSDASKEFPRVHRVFSHLKRWLLGTHHGAVRAKHLDHYLHEYEFRFNRRKNNSLGYAFHRLLELSVRKRTPTYEWIVSREVSPRKLVA